MAACREWTWPGGYLAAAREYAGVLQADIVVSDHDQLSLYRLAKRLGKPCAVLSNGWDSFEEENSPLPPELQSRIGQLGSFWLFLGRGGDPVKGSQRILTALKAVPEIRLVAVPGSGFEHERSVLKTGVLSSGQVRTILDQATGLVLPSLYEGLPLVVMESLAQGTPVLATSVGGLRTLPSGLQGLVFAKDATVPELVRALKAAQARFATPEARQKRGERARQNRELLPSWKTVALRAIRAIEEARTRVHRTPMRT